MAIDRSEFMITRSSIAFEDFLGSSIAPQVMPPWVTLYWSGADEKQTLLFGFRKEISQGTVAMDRGTVSENGSLFWPYGQLGGGRGDHGHYYQAHHHYQQRGHLHHQHDKHHHHRIWTKFWTWPWWSTFRCWEASTLPNQPHRFWTLRFSGRH